MLFGASLFELLTSNYFDMAILLGAQFINASISYYETQKALKVQIFFEADRDGKERRTLAKYRCLPPCPGGPCNAC